MTIELREHPNLKANLRWCESSLRFRVAAIGQKGSAVTVHCGSLNTHPSLFDGHFVILTQKSFTSLNVATLQRVIRFTKIVLDYNLLMCYGLCVTFVGKQWPRRQHNDSTNFRDEAALPAT